MAAISAVMFLKVLENVCISLPAMVDHRSILLSAEIILRVQCASSVGYNINSHNGLKNCVESSPLQNANDADVVFLLGQI